MSKENSGEAEAGRPAKKAKPAAIGQYLLDNGTEPNSTGDSNSTDRKVLWKVKTKMDTSTGMDFSYFVTDGTIKFRHEGRSCAMPDIFFLKNRMKRQQQDKVLVEFAASGSGKSVDLAGSSVSRGAHLAMVMTLWDTDSIREETDKELRNDAAFVVLSDKVKQMCRSIKHLSKLANLATASDPLKVVVAIDETSQCPLMVRSIISNVPDAEEAVALALGDNEKAFKVMFSISGTGASTGCAGSNVENYDTVEPSARSSGIRSMLCDYFLGDLEAIFPGETTPKKVTAKTIAKHLPVVSTLMENGRMASIAAANLRERERRVTLVEAKLVSDIVLGYMESNGMKDLLEEDRLEVQRMVAACALAADLFQWNVDQPGKKKTPCEPQAFAQFVADMECGVNFSKRVRSRVGDVEENPMKKIVSRYGLVEPRLTLTFKPGEKPKDIFVMKPAQQLVALTMLGMDAEKFLEATPFGFEVLSTHIVKCAIAATSVIEYNDRPSLQKALQAIGFQIDTKNTSDTIQNTWKDLNECIVVESSFSYSGGDRAMLIANAMKTRPMNVELLPVELCYKGTNENFLQIDSTAFKALKAMEPRGEDREFGPPSAWINYGPSPLADGFVTFYCQNKDSTVTDDTTFKFTIMNQAKDYHAATLNTKKLNGHACLCNSSVLDGVFGGRRLLCVAGKQSVVVARGQCAERRNFMPYAFDKGHILKDLLETLESQRNSKTRVLTYATFCNGNGEDVSKKYGLEREQP